MLLGLNLKFVGEAADWMTTLAKAPATNFNLLLVDWTLLPPNAATGLATIRQACSNAIFVVLTSYLDAHQQAARSAGADAFISKGEIPNRLADHLIAISRNLNSHKIAHHSKQPSKKKTSKISKESPMNKNILEGKWKQMRGEARAWWGKLTDDDLDRVAGKFEVLVGLLQERYGYTREQAADEIDRRVTDFQSGMKEDLEEDMEKDARLK
jgi:uncharacterized protein YjbJ (UPF0337 family)/CheY-like chemotaxis protein